MRLSRPRSNPASGGGGASGSSAACCSAARTCAGSPSAAGVASSRRSCAAPSRTAAPVDVAVLRSAGRRGRKAGSATANSRQVPVTRILSIVSTAMSGPETPMQPPARRDGGRDRWAAHRAARRAELIDAVLDAVRQRGPAVDMDDVAAVSGVAKPVFYRYFKDKADLFLAVGREVGERLVTD